jgi:hypothetical protein
MDALAVRMAAHQALPSLEYHFRRHWREFGAATSAEYFRLFGDHIRRADLRHVSLIRRHGEHRLWYLVAEDSGAVAQYDETEGILLELLQPAGHDTIPFVGSRLVGRGAAHGLRMGVRRVATIDDPEDLIESYGMYVTEGLGDDDHYDTEAILTLVLRDAIDERWEGFTPSQRERVADLDRILAQQHERVADVLPVPEPKDRRRWWWFLHKGPEVRQEALAAAREG